MKIPDPLELLVFYISREYTVTYVDRNEKRRKIARDVINSYEFGYGYIEDYKLYGRGRSHTDITIFVNPPVKEGDEMVAFKEQMFSSYTNIEIYTPEEK